MSHDAAYVAQQGKIHSPAAAREYNPARRCLLMPSGGQIRAAGAGIGTNSLSWFKFSLASSWFKNLAKRTQSKHISESSFLSQETFAPIFFLSRQFRRGRK